MNTHHNDMQTRQFNKTDCFVMKHWELLMCLNRSG